MAQHKMFGFAAGALFAALAASPAFAQSTDKGSGSSADPGKDTSGSITDQGSTNKGQGSTSKGQGSTNKGLGAGIGQEMCDCPCSTPGAKKRGGFGSGLPGSKEVAPPSKDTTPPSKDVTPPPKEVNPGGAKDTTPGGT
ncbi:MAG: hypothetical protein QM820_38475 [Minicystis sp.]